jgi:hypothetical protein
MRELRVIESLFDGLALDLQKEVLDSSDMPQQGYNARTNTGSWTSGLLSVGVAIGLGVGGAVVLMIGGLLRSHFALESAYCNVVGSGSSEGVTALNCTGAMIGYLFGTIGWYIGLALLVGGVGILIVVLKLQADVRQRSIGAVREVPTMPPSVPRSGDTTGVTSAARPDSMGVEDPNNVDAIGNDFVTQSSAGARGNDGVEVGPPSEALLESAISSNTESEELVSAASSFKGTDQEVLLSALTCPGCGSPVVPGDIFCVSCGERLYLDENMSPDWSSARGGPSTASVEQEDGGVTRRRRGSS